MAKRETLKRTRRARGSGTIFFSKSRQLWIGRVPCGVTKSGFTKYQELSDPSQLQLITRLKRLSPPGPETTVREWSVKWLESLSVSPQTRDNYSQTIDHYVNPALGNIRVAALTSQHCAAAVRSWGQRLGPTSIRVSLSHLRAMLTAARRAGLIQVNPAADVKPPRAPRKAVVTCEPGELPAIVAAALKHPRTYPAALIAATGLRIGEVVALDVTDFDQETGLLTISKTWGRRHGTRGAKSDQSYRTIRVPEPVRSALVAVRGKRIAGPLFTTWDGVSRLYTEAVRWRVKEACSRAGVKYRKPHEIRSMVATALHGMGIPIPDCSVWMGHTPAIFVKSYIRPTMVDPSERIGAMLTPARNGKGKRRA